MNVKYCKCISLKLTPVFFHTSVKVYNSTAYRNGIIET